MNSLAYRHRCNKIHPSAVEADFICISRFHPPARVDLTEKALASLSILSGEIGGGSTEALICLGTSVSVELGCDGIGCSHGMLFSEAYCEDDVDVVSLGA